MCPVCQHNKDKPDKHHVDFFAFVNASECFICQLDVNKNDSNAHVDKQAAELPTTQNAVLKTGLDVPSPLGHRTLACNNQCQCLKLAATLHDHCKICSTRTLRKNRKGWDEDMMRMMKAGDRGQADLFCCKLNDVIVHQWQDSGVVNVCSTTFDVWLWECTDKLVPTSCPSCVQTLFGNVNHVWC